MIVFVSLNRELLLLGLIYCVITCSTVELRFNELLFDKVLGTMMIFFSPVKVTIKYMGKKLDLFFCKLVNRGF